MTMPKLSEMSLEAVDVREWYDQFRSIQPFVDRDTNQEYILWVTICEVCHVMIRQTLRLANTNDLFGDIVSEQEYTCSCDDLW